MRWTVMACCIGLVMRHLGGSYLALVAGLALATVCFCAARELFRIADET